MGVSSSLGESLSFSKGGTSSFSFFWLDFPSLSIYYDEMDSDSELASMISHALSEIEITNIVTELEMVTSVDLLTKRPLQLLCNNSDF